MKRLIVLFVFLTLILISSPALCINPYGDVLLSAKVKDVSVQISKRGTEYVRITVDETRTLKGITYQVQVPVFAFGDHVQTAKTLKKGDLLKAICHRNIRKNGRVSYTILKIIKQEK